MIINAITKDVERKIRAATSNSTTRICKESIIVPKNEFDKIIETSKVISPEELKET
jgi:hypothetical protein